MNTEKVEIVKISPHLTVKAPHVGLMQSNCILNFMVNAISMQHISQNDDDRVNMQRQDIS